MGDFELDTRVEGSEGEYRANISQDWEVWGPNGGYVAAVAMRAAGQEAAIKRPVAFSAHFLGRARFEQVELEEQVELAPEHAVSHATATSQHTQRCIDRA